jgi:DNA-binding winged helix-turn-helix (wHTH) protein
VTGRFAFERFVLDTGDRRLTADGRPVELNGRYLDALGLLVREQGKLVSKDRFLSDVWRGVPVTDEALTQCIKTLRRQLADDAARPRFIETVPKHGYRFIAPVQVLANNGGAAARPASPGGEDWQRFVVTGSAGTAGGVVAGTIGGLVYGFAGASQAAPGVGTISVLLVLLCVTMLVASIGAAGVSFAIATAELARTRSVQWLTIAGAGGGLIVGAFGKLLGVDAFTLLVGHSPGEITGAMEGLLLGAAVGLGAWLASRTPSLRKAVALAALAGAIAGAATALLGGQLMLGSLALLTHNFRGSLQIDRLGRLFGEGHFGAVSTLVSGAAEGALFSACIVAALSLAQRRFAQPDA